MKLKARAKINLALNVASRRSDGYHELEMIMLPLDFYDDIDIVFSDEDLVELVEGVIPQENTMTKAIALMKETYHLEQCFKVVATKSIPMEAGLAGGSADAAAVMHGINRLCNLKISDEELAALSVKIGADVPFCVIGKPAVVSGIGEQIEPIDCICDFELLLVKPKQGVSTPQAFKTLDIDACDHPDISLIKEALVSNDYSTIINASKNSLEESALRLVPTIATIKEELLAFGFDFALMSGSGSCVFALTKDKDLIQNAMNAFDYDFMYHTTVAKEAL